MIPLLLLLFLSPAPAAELPGPALVEELRAIHPDAARHLAASIDAWTADPDRAEGLLSEAIRQAPGFAPLARVGCDLARERGHRSRAISWCRQAVRQAEDAANLHSLALALSTPAEGLEPTPSELAEAAELAVRATLLAPDDVVAARGLCEVALHADDGPRLQTCVTRLEALQPDALPTRYYAAHLSAAKGMLWAARRQLDEARAAGLSEALYDDAVGTFEARRSRGLVQAERTVGALALWMLAIGWMLGVAQLGRRQVERAVQERGEAPLEVEGAPAAVRVHRDVLRAVAATLGLGVVFLLAGLVVAGLGVLRLLATQPLPAWGLAGGVFFALVAICLLFLQLALRDPQAAAADRGFPIDLQSYPSLRRLLDTACEATGAEPVARVLLVPDCTLEVHPDASGLEQLVGQPDRLLWLGIGLLPSLSPQQLAARVTRELARDATEDGVLRLRRLIPAGLQARSTLPTAVSWNPWWVLARGLDRLWSATAAGYGAWADQEADRVAARAHGAPLVSSALRRTRHAEARWTARLDAVRDELLSNAPPESIYGGAGPTVELGPPPAALQRRIDALKALPQDKTEDPETGSSAWSVLRGRPGIEAEMTRLQRILLRTGTPRSTP